MKNLTDKQEAILEFIENFKLEKEYSPTFKEIAANFNVTPKTIFDQLNACRKKGFVNWIERQYRTVTVLRKKANVN